MLLLVSSAILPTNSLKGEGLLHPKIFLLVFMSLCEVNMVDKNPKASNFHVLVVAILSFANQPSYVHPKKY